MTIAQKVKNLSKKQKIMITVVAVLAIGGIGGTVYASQTQKKLSEAQSIVDKEQSSLKEIKVELQKLLDTKDKEFLAENVTNEQLTTLQSKYKSAMEKVQSLSVDPKKLKSTDFSSEKNDCKDLLETIENKLSTQEAVNQLYQPKDKTVALNGSKVTKDLAIVDDLKNETIQSVKKEHLQDTKGTTFDKTVLELVNNAENQVKQIDTAKTAVAKVYKDNKVVSTDSKLYDNAKSETDKVKNAKAKKALSDELTKVKSDIDKKAKEAEEQQKQEAQKVENEVNNTNQQAKTENETNQTVQETNNAENTVTNNQNDNSNSGSYVPQDNGSSQQQPAPPATGNENTGGQGGSGGETPPPTTGGGNSGGNGSTGGGSTAPQGYVGPFGSEAEADSYGRSNAVNGYQTMEMDGKWYVSVY